MSRTDMKGEFEEAFGDWPRTEFLDGEQALHITGQYVSPSWWWSKGFPIIMLLLSIFLLPMSCSLYAGARYGSWERMPNGEVGIYLVGYVVVMVVLVVVAEHFGRRRNLDVKLSADAIEIRGKRYARTVPHQFSIEEHEKTHNEELAARRGQSGGRVYRDAMQVVMRYRERRIPVGDFRRLDERKAEALLVRLQFFDQRLEEMLQTAAQGEAATPGEGDDFGPARPIR